MSQGWVSLNREILSHWIWQDKPFADGQAWVDLILMAAHSESKFRHGNDIVEVGRGEIVTSEKKLAERWGWSRTKVRSFLRLLEKDKMIIKKSTQKKTALTLTNYCVWQDSRTEKKPIENRSRTDREPIENTYNNVNHLNNENNVNNTPLTPRGEAQKTNIDFEKVLNFYNLTCNRMPQTKTLSETRKKAIRARIKEFSSKKVAEMFEIAAKSDFLNGKNNTGWTASIDWLLKPANFIKVLEGNYTNTTAPTKANDPRASLAEGYSEPL